MKTILFAGGTSLLAYSWTLKPNHNYNYILATHKRKIKEYKYKTLDLDFSQESVLSRKIEDNDVDIIINCIGLTNVEDCESNIKMADYANIQIAKSLASVCSKKKIKFIHISTDHLFDGTKSYYTENDIKSPLNNYAKTKSQAEDEILALNKDALIIRTNFFGWGPSYKNSFSDKILKYLESDKKIELFEDVFYSPISVDELKNQIFKLIKLNAKGIFNVASNERISKYHFGCQIAKIFGYSENLILKASINNYKNLTKRPREMSLSNHKLNTFTEGTIPSIEKQLEKLKNERNLDEQRHIIPYGRQDISQTDIDSVIKVLKSDFVTQGPVIQQFENKVAEYCNSKYAYACNSGTSALHIACLSLGVKKGDLVWTSPISFVASSNCALYCQADVDFVDIDSQTNNMSPKFLEDKLKLAKKSGRLPKVVIPVHLSGQSCDMKKIHKLSIEYGFKIIEDASHAIGA
jgi:dTDP-4-dehydrorhamnose reductase